MTSQTREGIKKKKLYEVERLALLVDTEAQKLGVKYLVDFGGGLGHMAMKMTSLGYSVIVVDGDQKLLDKIPSGIETVSMMVTHDKLGELEGRICDLLNGEPCLFYSLHACGSLSDCMINLYCRMAQARGIVNVGCCYNRIEYSVGRTRWSMNEKMAACQCPKTWRYNFQDFVRSGWLNFYRAVLQDVAKRKAFQLNSPKLSNIKLEDPTDFTNYFSEAQKRTGLSIAHEEYSEYMEFKRLYSTWWAVRAALGQSIEAQIIRERADYIMEHSLDVQVYRIFDIRESPRNYAILSHK